ncbi:MAG: sporulation protein YqfD [Clostridia bacterium]|nr:sporulation protein YqfD [Clostridia bacterium]
MTRFFRGSLCIECSGDCERLLKNAALHNLSLWEVERTPELGLRFGCAVEDIYKLRTLAHRSGCSLRVVRKRGAPFFIHRVLRRPVLVVGLVLTLAVLWAMGSRVWNIRIDAPENVDIAAMETLLYQSGLRVGMPVRQVRAQLIRNAMMSQCDELAFLTVNVTGTTAKVQLYPREELLAPLPDTSPCDIVSGVTGIITDIRIKNGTSSLRKWQSIYEGDLIASADMVDQHGQLRQVHAEAEIDVRTLYTRKCAVAKELFELFPTQNTKKRSYLVVGNRCIKLYLIESPGYKWYYSSVCRKTLSLKDGFDLPITLVTVTYTECEKREYTPDASQLEQMLSERMTAAFMLQRPDAALIDSSFTLLQSGGGYEGIMRFECSETTGIQIAR